MGMNFQVHVGFYLEVKPQKVVYQKQFYGCSHGIESNKKSAFNPHCGEPNKECTVPTERVTDSSNWLLSDDLSENVYSIEGKPFWKFNFDLKNGDGDILNWNYHEHYRGTDHEIIPDKILSDYECVKANPDVVEIMNYMKEKYGNDAVQLKFGSFSYYS
jgi:hypothetical protein